MSEECDRMENVHGDSIFVTSNVLMNFIHSLTM